MSSRLDRSWKDVNRRDLWPRITQLPIWRAIRLAVTKLPCQWKTVRSWSMHSARRPSTALLAVIQMWIHVESKSRRLMGQQSIRIITISTLVSNVSWWIANSNQVLIIIKVVRWLGLVLNPVLSALNSKILWKIWASFSHQTDHGKKKIVVKPIISSVKITTKINSVTVSKIAMATWGRAIKIRVLRDILNKRRQIVI